MRYSRTITAAVCIFAASLPPIQVADSQSAVAPAPADMAAPQVRKDSNTARSPEPWYADYPASEDIDGAKVFSAEPDLVEDVRWALDRFAEAGLDLPTVEVWIHADPSGCRGADGELHAGYLTMRDNDYVVFSCGTRFTVLHELAHVWDHHIVTDDIREAFLAERGLEVWGGGEWRLCGGEHMANIIAWGLHDQHVRPMSTPPSDDDSLARAFRLATGGIEPLP